MYGRLLLYVRRHAAALTGILILALLQVAIELARPWPAKIVVDYALAGRPLPAPLDSLVPYLPGATAPRGLLLWCVIAAIVIVAGGGILALWVLTATIAVAQRLVYDLSRDLFEKLQRLSLSFHTRHSVGDLLQRMSGDVFVVHMAISQVTLPVITSILSLAGMFVIMWRLDPLLALVASSVVPLLALALAFFRRPMDAATTRQFQRQGTLMALVEQALSAIKVIQGFSREPYMQRKLEEQAVGLGEAYRDSTRVSGVYKELTGLITGVASALVLCLGGWRVLAGTITMGDLLVFLGYLSSLYAPVIALASSVGSAVAVVARGRRVFEILESRDEVPERPGALCLARVRGDVVFERVSFGYAAPCDSPAQTRRPVLREVSFRARPGQITAIVGATGAGKTTLVSLLSRFYDPWEGCLLVDGHDVRDVTLRSLRENISLVLQEPHLFRMSVADNIALGRPDASRAAIEEAARSAHAHEFIERLPEGYDTIISEKGSTLSGGERQRIAIARAIIKDAPILILDEPTSALDARTEAKIFEALTRLMRDRTTFIISHRLSTIRRADQILALEDGHVVERGTHESLLERDEVYARLYRHQHIAAL
jgi:ABC-type multidrug transport system fused ATPase/permease subunit